MKKETKTISVVSSCFNEQDNVIELYKRLLEVAKLCPKYNFEYLFIDNASTDKTVDLLRDLALKSPSVKIIINTRNFGHIRSPYWGVLQSRGDATIYLASDLQDPPELIPKFIDAWESGFKVVLGVKPESKLNFINHHLRKMYYRFLNKISDVKIIKNSTGFGLYDKEVLSEVRKINDPYPFLRGIIAELGYEVKQIPFLQERRSRGHTKNNFYTLYDIGMLGIINHSITPIRIASLLGFLVGGISLIFAFIFIILKIMYWNSFPLGISPIIIGMFFMFGLILIFIGFLGEYIGSIHTYLQKRPVVVEKERINF